MCSRPVTTGFIKPGKTETPYLLFTGNRREFDSIASEIYADVLAPLMVGVVVAVMILLVYAFFTGKLG
jgi:hypothetical protein